MKLQILRRMLTTVYHGMSGNSIVIDPSFAKILLQAKKDVNSWGGEIYFVYLPEFRRYKYNVNHNSYNKKQEVIDLVKKLDIQVIDIHKEVFLKYKYPLELFPFERHNHYNAKGYKLVTKGIISSID